VVMYMLEGNQKKTRRAAAVPEISSASGGKGVGRISDDICRQKLGDHITE
jgi:hypothetical protein